MQETLISDQTADAVAGVLSILMRETADAGDCRRLYQTAGCMQASLHQTDRLSMMQETQMQETLSDSYQTADAGDSLSDSGERDAADAADSLSDISDRRMQETLYHTVDAGDSLSDNGSLYQTADAVSLSDSSIRQRMQEYLH